jgi:hypothetical protein
MHARTASCGTPSCATSARRTLASPAIAAVALRFRWLAASWRIAVVTAVLLGPALTAARADAQTVFGGVIGPAYEPFGLELDALAGQQELPRAIGRVEFVATLRCPGALPDLALGVAQRIVAPGVPAGPEELQGSVITAAGEFQARGTTRYSFGRLDGKVEEDFTGRIAGDVITGTFRARARLYRPDSGRRVATCRSGELHWRGESAPGVVFAGLTSRGLPVVLKLSPDRSQVVLVLVAGDPRCTRAGAGYESSVWTGLPVRPDGSFTGSDAYRYREGGVLVRGTDHVRGRVNGDRATGSFRDRHSATTRDGAVSRCRIRSTSWSASSSPTVTS